MNASTSTLEADLQDLATQAQAAWGENLLAITLFGSAAAGAQRARSDINVLFLLKRFELSAVHPMRELLRALKVRHNLRAMWVQADELEECSVAFADKFSDIRRRHRTLFGEDWVHRLAIDRTALIQREKQSLLNLELRLRERYAFHSLRPEQLSQILSDALGPLRAAAATWMEVSSQRNWAPKEALAELLEHSQALAELSAVREGGQAGAGRAVELFAVVESMVRALRIRFARELAA